VGQVDIALQPILAVADGWSDFDLLDSGAGRKLERFGHVVVIRPEPWAMWRPALGDAQWERADAEFIAGSDEGGRWRFPRPEPAAWTIGYADLRFVCRFTSFRHLGVFPEQAVQWNWISRLVKKRPAPKVLNLFAYTGGASFAAEQAGALVTHVDSSKKAIAWARENQGLYRDARSSIRWICDDARKFVRREQRRNVRYDGIILDPPKFGRGASGEVWKLNEHLPDLLRACRAVLSRHPLFVILTSYSIPASHLHLYWLMQEIFGDLDGKLESGEVALKEKSGGRVLPSALFCRWSGGAD
jgi:23S rRNA (cytosine1962-C5)-methyltransferase